MALIVTKLRCIELHQPDTLSVANSNIYFNDKTKRTLHNIILDIKNPRGFSILTVIPCPRRTRPGSF